jgi:hypothetical protein
MSNLVLNRMNNPTRLLVAGVLALTAGAAIAAGAHFVKGPDASLNTNTGAVTVTWKEAGLGDTTLVSYEASADGRARYQCVNNGNKCPAAANKQDVFGPVIASGTFASGRNGSITASLTIQPPAATLDCPGNQILKLVSVSYTDIALADLTNNVVSSTDPSFLSMSGPECP